MFKYFRAFKVKYIMSAFASPALISSTSLSYIAWLKGILNIFNIIMTKFYVVSAPPPHLTGHS